MFGLNQGVLKHTDHNFTVKCPLPLSVDQTRSNVTEITDKVKGHSDHKISSKVSVFTHIRCDPS